MAIKFLVPEILWFLIPILLFIVGGFAGHYFLRKRFNLFLSRIRAEKFSCLKSTRQWMMKFALLGLVLACIVLILSQPVSIQPTFHQNFIVMFDISKSMSVEDYWLESKPCSRLKMAKLALLSLVDELPPDARLSVITFTGDVITLEKVNLIRTFPQEVGRARQELAFLIRWIHWSQAWSAGSPIQRSVISLAELMNEQPGIFGKNPTIIVITDGEENSPPPNWFSDQKAKKIVEREKFPISRDLFKDQTQWVVVGVGTLIGGNIPNFNSEWQRIGYEKNYQTDQLEVSHRDDAFLQTIGQKLGAEFKIINSPDDLKSLAANPAYKTEVSESQKDISVFVIIAALIFFLAAIVL